MSTENDKALNNIVKAITYLFNQEKDKLYFDRTHQGRIVTVLGSNKYTVAIQGADYTSVPSCNDMTYVVNEGVWVTMPQNDWDNMFILGRRR